MAVVDYDAFQAEQIKTRQDDTVCIRGHISGNYNLTGTSVSNVTLSPGDFPSIRLQRLSSGYTRFRFNKLVVKCNFTATAGDSSSGPIAVMAVDDDAAYAVPTTSAAVAALRCSTTFSGRDSNSSDILTYTPVNKDVWYYCQASSDARFKNQATFYIANPTGTAITVNLQFAFTVVFKGAGGANSDNLYDSAGNSPLRLVSLVEASISGTNDDEGGDYTHVASPKPNPKLAIRR